jgi:hypothetical protein
VLKDKFSPFGSVGRVVVTYSNRTGTPMNALIEFETATDAEAAIKSCKVGEAGFAFVN